MAVPRVWAVIVAAGWGERFGGPKQFAELGGARLVDHAVATAAATCDAVVLVVPDASDWQGADVDGGQQRQRRGVVCDVASRCRDVTLRRGVVKRRRVAVS